MNGVGRVVFMPFAPVKDSALKDLGIGFSGSAGREDTSINGATDRAISYKTIGRYAFLSIQNGVAIYGQRYRLNPQMSYYYGSFGFMSEYMQSTYNMSRGGVTRDITNSGWTAQASYVLTGEKATINGVTPAHPFSLKDGTWGAFELGVRYNAFEGDKDLFAGKSSQLLATTTSVQKADAYGAALKWYLTNNLLWAWDYEYTSFSGLGLDRQPEQALVTRIQIDF
jgi:phosphate-selective porin OprO/OprP